MRKPSGQNLWPGAAARSARRAISAPSEHDPKVVAHVNYSRRSPDGSLGVIASRARVDSAFQGHCSVRYGNLNRPAIKPRASLQRPLNTLFDVRGWWLTLDRDVIGNAYDAAQFAYRSLCRLPLILTRYLPGKAHPPTFHGHLDA